MRLKTTKQSSTGLNTMFKDVDTGKSISRKEAIKQIKVQNPLYEGYHTVKMRTGTEYVRSNPDKNIKNNIDN